jgi:hypothetical protein
MNEFTLEKFWADVEKETEEARGLFLPSGYHLDNDLPPRSVFINVVQEEMGKLARCINKLLITRDSDQRGHWLREGEHRIITSVSLLRRFAERWYELPDTPSQFIAQRSKDARS